MFLILDISAKPLYPISKHLVSLVKGANDESIRICDGSYKLTSEVIITSANSPFRLVAVIW